MSHNGQPYHLGAIASRSARQYGARWLLAALVVVLGGWFAACARASTIAYLNTSNNNVYVADSSGADATEVASGVTSPSLADNGDLYALNGAGTAADEFKPGVGADGSTSLPGGSASQLALQPNEGSLMWSTFDGGYGDGGDANVLNLATNATQTINLGLDGHWGAFGRLTVPTYLPAGSYAPEYGFSTVKVDSAGAVRTIWYPQLEAGLGSLGFLYNVIEYGTNPQGTLTAAAITYLHPTEGTLGGLVILPINPITLLPAISDPLINGCEINDYYSAFGFYGEWYFRAGDAFAWAPNGSTIAYDDWNSGISTATVGPWNSNCSQIGARNRSSRTPPSHHGAHQTTATSPRQATETTAPARRRTGGRSR